MSSKITTNELVDFFVRARARIGQPERVVMDPSHTAESADGKQCAVGDPQARRWCLLGAIGDMAVDHLNVLTAALGVVRQNGHRFNSMFDALPKNHAWITPG